ncbi:cytochrome protein [Colletotrichum phormii]|uniref:Cytochrome protein n=1 Tax=Colletotrichum phormii TaxID=359342 RepID=A0AAJ0EEJ3_9PEZI|nr:cytochrome protein [Colletotrichum phormii]KAK1637102.1 cytochrome protein [Colletotrichum phormii]
MSLLSTPEFHSPAAFYGTIGLVGIVAYLVSLAIYRLYFSPLAKFPGPRLAALTQWYETYYELFSGDGGQFIWHYAKLHEEYGPILRINPWELHIQDSSFYDVLYSSSRHSSKLTTLAHRFNSPESAFSTVNHSRHRQRRAALNPFFSHRRIAEHQPNIQRMMHRLTDRVTREYLGNDKVLRIDQMWGCWTSDIINDYAFDKPHNFLDAPDFHASYTDAMVDLLEPVHYITQFPLVTNMFKMLPLSWVKAMSPQMGTVLDFNNEMMSQIRILLNKPAEEKGQSKTIFGVILESDLPPSEKTVGRLQQEAISVTGAGIETTMRALSLCTFHVLANPPVQETLQAELREAISDPRNPPDWDALSQLPYLTACINEALRFAYGTSQRLPRTLEDEPLRYGEWLIPVGATVSMDNFAVSHDEAIFPDNMTFRPERWLGDPKAPDRKKLSRYMVAFGRGTRSCVGMQLAWAELYTGIATLFRRFKMELYETERDAMDLHMDRFVPRPKPHTLGVRALVKEDLYR